MAKVSYFILTFIFFVDLSKGRNINENNDGRGGGGEGGGGGKVAQQTEHKSGRNYARSLWFTNMRESVMEEQIGKLDFNFTLWHEGERFEI